MGLLETLVGVVLALTPVLLTGFFAIIIAAAIYGIFCGK